MSDVTLYFLGQAFEFPADIDDFVRITLKFNTYEERLMDAYQKAYAENKFHSSSADSISYYKMKMLQLANDVKDDLSKDRISFGEPAAFVNFSDGYRKLLEVCDEVMPKIRKIRSNYMLTKPQIDAQASALLKEEYFPRVEFSLRLYCNELLKYQLKAITDAGVYDFSRIKEYDIAASFETLRELEKADDKRAVLIKAFELCPFNSELYIIAQKLSLADIHTFETAKYLGIDYAIKDKLIEYCIQNIMNDEKISVAIAALADFSSESRDVTLDRVYAAAVKSAKEKFRSVSYAIGNNIALESWIKNNLCCDIEEYLGTSDAVIFEHTDKYIDSVMTVECFRHISYKTGISHTDFAGGDDYQSFEDYVLALKDKLSERVRWMLDKIAEDRYKQQNADSVFDRLQENYRELHGDELSRLEKRVERLKDQIILFGIIDAFRGGRLFMEYLMATVELEAYKKTLENAASEPLMVMSGIKKEKQDDGIAGFGATTTTDFIKSVYDEE